MTFKVPAKKKDVARFEFELPNESGKADAEPVKCSMPLIRYIPAEAAEAFEDGKDIRGLILAADNAETKAALRSLDADQIKVLLAEWEKQSEDELGESSAS